MTDLHFTLNGKACTLPSLPGEKLSDLLRQRLRLTGTKIGCGEGRCGSCIVLLDGKPVHACLTQAVKIEGKNILTVEGLAQEGGLHPLQQAFIAYGAVQCGFCTSGQLMRAYALLQENENPTESEIRAALDEVLCRCGSYAAIVRAVKAAATCLRTGEKLAPAVVPLIDSSYHSVGKVNPRPDALPKVTGAAVFTDDLSFEGMLYARVLRAGVPSAILRSLDVSAAQALPGVIEVLTAADLPAVRNHGLYVRDWPILVAVGERIRYQGDALALVAAKSQQIADQAVREMQVEFEPRPVISSPRQALAPEAEPLHEQGNLLKHISVRKGDVLSGFAQAEVILEHTFHTPSCEHFFMEPECSIVRPLPDGTLELYCGSQIPYADREQVAVALGLPPESVRVRGQLTGGAFGGKEDIAGQIHAALLAQATGLPVKLLFTRRESLLVHPKRHASEIRVRLGAKRDGTLTAVETELFGDTGAYASLGDKVMTRATTHSAGPYVVPNVKSDCYAMYTNNPPAGAFRGFGVVQAAFAIENMMDELAHTLQMDPFSLRLKNALVPGSLTNTNQRLDESVGLTECLLRVEGRLRQLGEEQPFIPRRVVRPDGKALTCWGVAAGYKNTGLGGGAEDASGAEVALLVDGHVEVRTAAAEVGQGMVTTLQLIVAEVLQCEPQDVSVFVMDTALTLDGGPTTASRQTFVSGNAARLAAEGLKAQLTESLAACYQMDPAQVSFSPACVRVADERLSWAEVARRMTENGTPMAFKAFYQAPETSPLEKGGKIHFAYGFAVQAVQIEIDLQTGAVRLLQAISANDAGKVLNPLGFMGQVEGGVIMGLGTALMEDFRVEQGVIWSDRTARYPIPRISDLPRIESIVVEHPMREGPFGAKGVGELVSIPTAPAVTNAIANAIGLRVDRLPVRREQVLAYLQGRPEFGGE